MMTTPDKPFDKISEATREEERLTEDEIARRKLGPRGVPGAPDTANDDAPIREEYAEGRRIRRSPGVTDRAGCHLRAIELCGGKEHLPQETLYLFKAF